MVNSQVVREINNAFKIDERVATTPAAMPVIEVGVKSVKDGISKSLLITNALSGTIYTTPTDQDFYLTGCALNLRSDSGAASTNSAITYIKDGQRENLLIVAENPGSSAYISNNITFHPIKVDRGTTILITNSSATSNIRSAGNIYGFIDEVN